MIENKKTFLQGKYDWTNDTFQSIDWEAISSSIYKKPIMYVIAIIKMIHRWQPTNKVVARYTKGKTSNKCCLCDNVEHQHHYMTCEHNIYVMARKNAWLDFKKKMKKWKIDQTVFQFMWYVLQTWMEEEQMPDVSELLTRDVPDADNIIRAFQDQTKIGWNHFALGRLARTWKQCFVKKLSGRSIPGRESRISNEINGRRTVVDDTYSMETKK